MKRAAAKRSTGRAFEQCSSELHAPGWLVTLGACAVHLLLLGGAWYLSGPSRTLAARPPARELFEVELTPAKVAPPVVEPAVAEPEPPEPAKIKLKPARTQPPPAPAPEQPEPEKAAEPEPPAPAAAQAGQALTQAEETPASTSDTIVTGQGAGYAGGTTERGGSAQHQVTAQAARAFGVEGGTGTAAADRTRAPQLAAGLRWDCPTPQEALEEGVEHAVVGLMVEIDIDGKVLGVEIKGDPGYGFAREARACALRKRWISGLDRSGQPRRAKQLVNVNF